MIMAEVITEKKTVKKVDPIAKAKGTSTKYNKL